MMIPVPSRSVVVCAATKESATAGSRKGASGGAGEGGACGSGSTTCSAVQTDSKPAASAARAMRTAVSGSEHSPVLMPKSPNFIAASRRSAERRPDSTRNGLDFARELGGVRVAVGVDESGRAELGVGTGQVRRARRVVERQPGQHGQLGRGLPCGREELAELRQVRGEVGGLLS